MKQIIMALNMFMVPTVSFAQSLIFPVPTEISSTCNIVKRDSCATFKYSRKVNVSNVNQLKAALADLKEGDLVQVASGVYQGRFIISLKASTNAAYICADSGAIIDGGDVNKGYGLHLNGARNIVVSGLTVRNAQKGVMMDAALNVTLNKMTIQNTGTEGVHFRNNTKNSVLVASSISEAGLVEPDFGEGVYVGSAKNKWCPNEPSCGNPDRSDCNYIAHNKISAVRAESIDVKEGTQKNLIKGNSFKGAKMTGAYADSFMDVKGNNNIIIGNSGVVGNCGGEPCQVNGFQTHVVLEGWGTKNYFDGNFVSGNLEGPVVSLQKVLLNVVTCNNKADNGAKASSDLCR